MKYVYLLHGSEPDRELAEAEALALTGGRLCARRLVEADVAIDPARTGYVSSGIELLAAGTNTDAVCRRVAEAKLSARDFAIEVVRIPARLNVHRREVAGALAWVLDGHPNLDRPAEQFRAYVTATGVWFGRALDAEPHDWKRFVRKPHDSSSALPAQVARAVCNLLLHGGERVVDPCCGTGSLLLQAAALGARITGFDLNKKMVGATNKNLEHFGFAPAASLADAAHVKGAFDVVLCNLPYGKMSPVTDDRRREMVRNIAHLAPRGVIIAADDIGGDLRAAETEVPQVLHLRKFTVTRRIFLFRS